MNKVFRAKKNLIVNASNYVNAETGELMSSEVNNNITISVKQGTNQFIINSDNYVTFTKEAMDYLYTQLSSTDIGKITTISNMLKTDCSIISMGNNYPHTPESLSITLGLHINKWYEFVRKMVKKNILSYCVCAPSGYVQKIYMLNPYIARKRTSFNCELSLIFRDITKDGILID